MVRGLPEQKPAVDGGDAACMRTLKDALKVRQDGQE